MGVWRAGACAGLAVLLLACANGGKAEGENPPRVMAAEGGGGTIQEVLPQLAKAHSDKVQLAMFVGMPFIHRVDPAVKAFAEKMGEQNKELLKDLKAYAEANKISLKFEYSADANGRAQKGMEDEQSKALQGAGGTEFELLVLVLEYSDYGWNKALVKTTLEKEKGLDPALKAYLEKSLKVHEEGIREIEGLLKRFQFK